MEFDSLLTSSYSFCKAGIFLGDRMDRLTPLWNKQFTLSTFNIWQEKKNLKISWTFQKEATLSFSFFVLEELLHLRQQTGREVWEFFLSYDVTAHEWLPGIHYLILSRYVWCHCDVMTMSPQTLNSLSILTRIVTRAGYQSVFSIRYSYRYKLIDIRYIIWYMCSRLLYMKYL